MPPGPISSHPLLLLAAVSRSVAPGAGVSMPPHLLHYLHPSQPPPLGHRPTGAKRLQSQPHPTVQPQSGGAAQSAAPWRRAASVPPSHDTRLHPRDGPTPSPTAAAPDGLRELPGCSSQAPSGSPARAPTATPRTASPWSPWRREDRFRDSPAPSATATHAGAPLLRSRSAGLLQPCPIAHCSGSR